MLGEMARRFHGDTLLWAGCHQLAGDTVRGCMIRHRFFAATAAFVEAPDDLLTLRCELSALPVPNNCLDAMVLHHGLENTADPRSALREAARALHPGGRLVICAFNPISLVGLRRLYAGVVQDEFSGLHCVRAGRLLDWLSVLGFELQGKVKYLAYNLPLNKAGKVSADGAKSRLLRRQQLPGGGVYILSAVKQAMAVRPNWQSARLSAGKLNPAAYPNASVARPMGSGRVHQFPE
jgi:SAM-dependent methyltransferase